MNDGDANKGAKLTMDMTRIGRICYRFFLVLVAPIVGIIAFFTVCGHVVQCLSASCDEDYDDDDCCEDADDDEFPECKYSEYQL